MSQFLSQVARQVLQQQQRLTPQLIQAMDILQLNAQALESRIEQELDDNPALELAPDSEPEETVPERISTDRSENEEALVVQENGEKDFERLSNLLQEYDDFDDEFEYRGTRSRARLAEEGDNKLEAMANAAARPISLHEYLIEQWRLVDADPRTRRLGEAIIAAINTNGRLATPLEQIVRQFDPPESLPHAKDALARVQQLDPPGIAARDLRECLLLQLEILPQDTELERQIIEKHFEDLQRNRLPQIAAALGVSLDRIKGALHVIRRLSLHPGRDVVDDAVPRVMPDVIVEYNQDEQCYDVRLTRATQKELRIAPAFRRILQQARDDRKAREFIKEKLEAASAIIDAVRYRNERLLEVARAVVQAQREFLDRGEQHLHVLRMSDLAERFGCDPSTISRTVHDKWIQTPRGIYPLRWFFTGGTDEGNGEALGWQSIKAKVKEIIDREDKSRPLSDEEIVARLEADGIHIKRRTVAKYRAQFGIPTARQRRQF